MEIIEKISIEDVRGANPANIYYAVHTCWWTHDPQHLSKIPGSGLPCDPRGAVLMMTDRIEDFLKTAESKPDHYGKHGLRAFMAAHHDNCVTGSFPSRPWSAKTWQEYNDALDRLDQSKGIKYAVIADGTSELIADLALKMYAGEPCRICGLKLTTEDIKNGAVFAGYSRDIKSRSAHKECFQKGLPKTAWACQ